MALDEAGIELLTDPPRGLSDPPTQLSPPVSAVEEEILTLTADRSAQSSATIRFGCI